MQDDPATWTELRRMAESHWAYSAKIMRLMYVEAFMHGYKHGGVDRARAYGLPDGVTRVVEVSRPAEEPA